MEKNITGLKYLAAWRYPSVIKKKKCNFLLHEAKFWIANAKVFGGTKWFCSKFFALIVLNIFQRVVQKLHEYIFKKDNSVAVIICRQLEGVFALYFVPDINLRETSITTIRQRRKTLALYDFHVFLSHTDNMNQDQKYDTAVVYNYFSVGVSFNQTRYWHPLILIKTRDKMRNSNYYYNMFGCYKCFVENKMLIFCFSWLNGQIIPRVIKTISLVHKS